MIRPFNPKVLILISLVLALCCIVLDAALGNNVLVFHYIAGVPVSCSIAPVLAAGLAVGAGSLLGGTIGGLFNKSSVSSTNESNLQAARETNATNERLFREQIAEQWKMWNAQNEYNDPKMQAARLKAAGINPQLALENQGSVGTAQSMTAPSASPSVTPTFQPVDYSPFASAITNGITDAVGSYLQAKMTEQQGAVLKEQANSIGLDNKLKRESFNFQLLKIANDAKLSTWERKEARRLYEFNRKVQPYLETQQMLQPDYTRALKDNVIQSTNVLKSQELMNYFNIELGIRADSRAAKQLESQLAKDSAEIGLMAANKWLSEEQARHEVEKKSETIARTALTYAQKNTEVSLRSARYKEIKARTYQTLMGVLESQMSFDAGFGKIRAPLTGHLLDATGEMFNQTLGHDYFKPIK